MAAMRGNDSVPYSTDALFQEIVNELKPDGIEMRLVRGNGDASSPLIEAWYPGRPDHIAEVHCGPNGRMPETADCLATAIREQLHAPVAVHTRHFTWDHTGTLWPD
jgi:hypothetical protein